MATTSILRALPRAFSAARSTTSGLRAARVVPAVAAHFSTTTRVAGKAVADLGAETGVHGREETAAHGHEESFEEFTARFEKEFDGVQDVFELQRNLNNAFAYDLVPSPSVIIAALNAARRVNDFPTAVRIFEGIKAKVENKGQYEQYLEELRPLREELGVELKEDLYPEESK